MYRSWERFAPPGFVPPAVINPHPRSCAILTRHNDPTIPPLLEACTAGDLSTVQRLANGRSLKDGSLNFGLYKALEADHVSVVQDLLQRGVNIDRYAITKTKSQNCFQLLLDHGLLLDDVDSQFVKAALG
jgi:hypothetical protein